MTRSVQQRHHSFPERDRAEASDTALERLPSTQRVMEQLPPLPSNAIDRITQFAFRLPGRLRVHALRIIANKLAADFAMRFLLLLEDSLNGQQQRPAHEKVLDIQDADDAQVANHLLELWAELPRHLDVRDARSFERFVRVTAGLRMMIDAAPDDALDAWVFDSGSQYRSMLTQTGVLPPFAISAYGTTEGVKRIPEVEFKLTRFDGHEPGTYTSRVGWAVTGSREDSTGPIQARLVNPPAAAQGSVLASAS